MPVSDAFKSTAVKPHMTEHGVTQRFILSASSWWGKFYERLVKSVKAIFKKVFGKSLFTLEGLQTDLCT